MRAFLMMVSWLRSLLGLGSSLPFVETPLYVLGKGHPCPILLVSGTNTNYCRCVTFSPRCFASLRAVVIYRLVLWREVEWTFVSYCQGQDCAFRVRRACRLHARARWAERFSILCRSQKVAHFCLVVFSNAAACWAQGSRLGRPTCCLSTIPWWPTLSLCSFVYLKHSIYFKTSPERLMHNSHTNMHKLQGSLDSSALVASPSSPQPWCFVLV